MIMEGSDGALMSVYVEYPSNGGLELDPLVTRVTSQVIVAQLKNCQWHLSGRIYLTIRSIVCVRWAPHQAIVAIRDHGGCICALLYSYINKPLLHGWGVHTVCGEKPPKPGLKC